MPAAATTTAGLRLFYAVWPDDGIRDALSALQAIVTGRKTRRENLHITLAFLGQQSATRVAELAETVHRLPDVNMTLQVDRLGYFARQAVAWAGMTHVPPELDFLRSELVTSLNRQGVRFDGEKRFVPHVTLARNAEPPPETALKPIVWPVRRLALVESVLSPEGVQYQVRALREMSP
jgi:2'-5' RNA ligase